MSAPVFPVACVIGIPPDGKARRHVIAAEYATTVREGDLPALAVPDALWGDDAFIDALQARFGEPERRVWHRCFDAIHAELRERADVQP